MPAAAVRQEGTRSRFPGSGQAPRPHGARAHAVPLSRRGTGASAARDVRPWPRYGGRP